MTEVPGFLEFFILEASEYVEQLDGLLLGGGSGGPNADALQRVARALRGSATMAKLNAFSNLATAVERVGRAMNDGSLSWEPALGGALIAAIDDLKTSLHAARTWSPSDERRANARSAELAKYVPLPASPGAATASSPSAYLSTEAANIAAGLELLTTRAGDAETAANVLKRIRALRGVAGVKEIAPLADALEATEEAGRALESGKEALTPEARRLLEAAAAYLRALASAIRANGDVGASTPARQMFETALEVWASRNAERDRVVPIADLFYSDGGAGIVEPSRYPPTTASERFRLELVSLGEHLRQVVNGARQAKDPSSVARAQRELRRVLQALEAASESFGEREIADFVRAHRQAADNIDFLGLSSLGDLASLVAEPGTDGQRLRGRVRELAGGRDIATAIGAGFGRETPLTTPAVSSVAAPFLPVTPSIAPSSARRPAPPETAPAATVRSATPPAVPPVERPDPVPAFAAEVPKPAAPSAPVVPSPPPAPIDTRMTSEPVSSPRQVLDPTAAALIDSSIAALEAFGERPMLPPIPLAEDQGEIVPIESLLYGARAALDRAVELRDQIRGVSPAPDPDTLDELFDLLELARSAVTA